MRYAYIFCVLILMACNTVRVKNDSYKFSDEAIDFLAIGENRISLDQRYHFESFGFPKIDDKIKLYVEILPYTKKLNKVYIAKEKHNQALLSSKYIDSLKIKPDVLCISIADKSLLVSLLNNQNNKELRDYIQRTQKQVSIITSFVLSVDKATIEKVKQADSYYLEQVNDSKYEVALFINNKKKETIHIPFQNVIAYQTNNFCWVENTKGNWLIGYLVEGDSTCDGDSYKKIQPTKEKSLYKM